MVGSSKRIEQAEKNAARLILVPPVLSLIPPSAGIIALRLVRGTSSSAGQLRLRCLMVKCHSVNNIRSNRASKREAPMTRDAILTELKAERARLDAAIAALESGPMKPRKRPRAASAGDGRPKRRRRMSAEARKKVSQAKKKWWERRKKTRS